MVNRERKNLLTIYKSANSRKKARPQSGRIIRISRISRIGRIMLVH